MAYDLTTFKLNKYQKCVTLDIKDLLTNIPITETVDITKHKLRYNHLTEDTITQYTKLLHTVFTQNYFTYDNIFYTCNKGVASTRAEILLQHYENLFIKHWIEDTPIMYYSRYRRYFDYF
jgi:hypothetical protein